MIKNISILFLLLLLVWSCQTEGQITGVPNEPQSWKPVGDNPGNGDFYSIQDFYFDFGSSENYGKEYWKFDLLDFQATNLEFSHCGPSCNGVKDIFTLSTFHNSYYIPPESFIANASSIVYVQNSNYNPNDPSSEEYVVFDGYDNLSDLLNEEVQNVEQAKKIEDFTLSTPNLNPTDPIAGMIWVPAESMYDITTMPTIRDTINYSYDYDYYIQDSFTALDTLKNPRISNHMYVIDPTEISDSIRSYVLYDSLSVPSSASVCNQNDEQLCNDLEICSWNEDNVCVAYTPPVTIDREYDFYGYVNEINDDFGFRKTTDCNDNYQQDPAELAISDFESSCLGDFVPNQSSPCASVCSNFGDTVDMDQWCWNQFSDMERLTARCVEDGELAFCDMGNALFDQKEYLYDQDGNGVISIVAGTQQTEPFEDRNCNGLWDGDSEVELNDVSNQEQCLLEPFATWDYYNAKCFYDTGNGQWDDVEECNSDFGQSCQSYDSLSECNCNYRDLYERGLAPSYLIVNYLDEANPVAKIDIFPSDVFADCGSDGLCDKNEIVNGGFDPGTCIADNYSGSNDDCCKNNLCWNYSTSECDFNLNDCNFDSIDDIWTENLDPAGDNCVNCNIDDPSSNPPNSGTERNFQWDQGEEIKQNFGDNAYTEGTTYLTKFLPYLECYLNYDPYAGNEAPVSDNCGGNTIEIISSKFKKGTSLISFQKYDSEVNVSSFDIIAQIPQTISWLTNLDIVKTQWPSDNAADGTSEDYMLFLKDDESVKKIIQPYYYYADTPGSGTGTDYIDYSNSQWWQAFDWEEDILIPSMNLEDESTMDTSYVVYSNVGNYEITKEYEVKKANATMKYSDTVEDCLLLTKVVTMEMIGPGPYFKVMSQTYLKDSFDFESNGSLDDVRLVKEVISWAWNPPYGANADCPEEDDYLGCGINWTKISAIEYKGESNNSFSNNGQSPMPMNLESIENLPGFNGDPFRLSNTMGFQRVVAPPEFNMSGN
tara:strand:+ start:205 stop:3183 length:2979 start_codon:yes stop_codon:yes gene_type:complete